MTEKSLKAAILVFWDYQNPVH